MKFKWVLVVFLLVSLVQIDAQKRKKDKKKESEAAAVVVEEKVAEEAKPEKNGKKGRTTAATTTTTPAPVIEEEPEEEVLEVVNETRESSNGCPSELKPNKDSNHACTCLDNLEDGAIMVECTALTSAAEMHNIFNTFLLGRRIDAIDVRNSTLGPLLPVLTGQSYTGTVLMRGNQIESVDQETFKSTDQNLGRLDLSSNNIKNVVFSMFDNYGQLQVLNLGENQLTSIDDAGQAPSLRVLYLYSNKINSISAKAFNRLESLEYLDLRWNELQVISPSAFEVAISRWQLRIRSNQIASMDNAFGEGTLPYLMDLSSNNVAILKDTVFGPLTETALLEGSKIYLGGNPITCNCSLSWLIRNTTLLQTVEMAKCDKDGMPITDLDPEDFRTCPPPKAWISSLARVSNNEPSEADESE